MAPGGTGHKNNMNHQHQQQHQQPQQGGFNQQPPPGSDTLPVPQGPASQQGHPPVWFGPQLAFYQPDLRDHKARRAVSDNIKKRVHDAIFAVVEDEGFDATNDMSDGFNTFNSFDTSSQPPDQLAALASPGAFTRKRQRDYQQQSPAASRPKRHFNKSPTTQRPAEGQRTFSSWAQPRGGRNQGRHRRRRAMPMPKTELPADAPKPSADKQVIDDYIVSKKVCFFHAREKQCPKMVEQGCCPYLHTTQPIPFGAYPRDYNTKPPANEEEARLANQHELLMVQAEQLQHDQTELPFSTRRNRSHTSSTPLLRSTRSRPTTMSTRRTPRRRALSTTEGAHSGKLLGGTRQHYIARESPWSRTFTTLHLMWLPPTERSTTPRSHQAWVRAVVWNNRTRQQTRVLNVLVDSGAGGGNFASAKFIREIELAMYGGRNLIFKRDKGRLRAANPESSKELPMMILGTGVLFLVFLPVDRVFAMRVRVVEQLPLGLIVGTEFLRRYESSLILERPGSGWFKPTPTSKRVPRLPWLERPRQKEGILHAMEGASEDDQEENAMRVRTPDDQEWIISLDENQTSAPSEAMVMEALELGVTVWQDEGTLKWDMTFDRDITVPGNVSVELEVQVEGSIPYTKTLVVVYPRAPFNLDSKDNQLAIGIAKGAVWWIPGSRLKVKVDNLDHTPAIIPKGMVSATAFINSDDVERMNTKLIKVIEGREVTLPLYDENVKPFSCKAQRFSPQMSDILMKQINDILEAGILSFATSEWCARIVPVLKKDGTYRLCIDYRELNKLLQKNVNGLGDIVGVYDRMKGSKYFSSIDLKSAYHQLRVAKKDRHKTAFLDPTGRLLQWNVSSFGITTIPAFFSATLGDDLREEIGKGVENWLDDIGLHSATFEEHLELVRRVVKILIARGYTGNFQKSEFFLSEIEFLGVMLGRDGVRPAPSKIKAVQELAIPTNVGEVRSFLGLAGYLRGFVPNFSAIRAPVSNILRNPAFSSKKARLKKVPWGSEQTEDFLKIIELLTTHSILILPDWSQPFTVHADASNLATGAVLTQEVDGGARHRPVGYHSKRLSRAQQNASANDREFLGVLHVVEHFEIYLQHRQFTLITDCSALLWLFTSQHLSSKMHRECGTRCPVSSSEAQHGGKEELPTQGPSGLVLDGVPLQQLAQQLGEEKQPPQDEPTDMPPDLAALALTSRDDMRLDGICLADLRATEVDDSKEESLTTFYALHLMPEQLGDSDQEWLPVQEEVQQLFTARKPRAVFLGRGAGGALEAMKDALEVTHVIAQDWMTFACLGANGRARGADLARHPITETMACQKILSEAKPEVLVANACWTFDDIRLAGATKRNATAIVQLFTSSRTQILLMETPVSTLDEAQELEWSDYVKLPTTRVDFVIPNTMRRKDAARVMQEWRPAPMWQEVVNLLQLRGWRQRRMNDAGGTTHYAADPEEELIIRLATLWVDSEDEDSENKEVEEGDVAVLQPAETAAIGDRSRYKIIPRVTRRAAAARRETMARQDQLAKEVVPRVTRAAAATRRTHEYANMMSLRWHPQHCRRELTTKNSKRLPRGHIHPPTHRHHGGELRRQSRRTLRHHRKAAAPSSPMPDDDASEASMPGVDLPTPTTEETADASTPLFRGPTEQLERMERILRDPAKLAEEQQKDFVLGPIRRNLETGKGEVGDYVLDDQKLLFHAPRGKLHAIALPRRLIPGVLALAHGTFAHPGSARTTIIIADKYHWPSLKKGVRRYVTSCRCRMSKRPSSAQLRMLPARFLRPWDVLELDILDMKTVANSGSRYLLVGVDRATKFLFGFPLKTKERVGVSRKLLGLLLIFGLPTSIRCDPGRDNTSEIMEHPCRWLKVSLDFGPANHPRGQGTVERMGAVLAQLLSELCQAWPRRWEEYVTVATWTHRMQQDESLPGNASPCQMLFGRSPRTPLDQLAPSLDNSGAALGLEPSVEETRHKHIQVTEALRKRQAEKNRQRNLQNARFSRTSPGAKAKEGDKVLVRESASTLHRDGTHPKLAHDHFTGPWVVITVVCAGLSFTVRLNERHVRQRTVAASDMKPFYSRPLDVRLAFEDEFAHYVWEPDLGLVEDSVVAAPLYTLFDRRTTQAGGAPTAWAWEYKGKYQEGTPSDWLTEDTVKDSFSPLQLGIFHALCEDYHGTDVAPRPPGALSRGEHEVATREAALKEFPLDTEVARELLDSDGNVVVSRGKVCDFYDPYWRVKFSDDDWEELTRRELRQGVALAAQIPPASQEA
ncbi:unnamed protein product [Ectocarpus sp. CCAP 1310/34]|nr:unnamed protein product [Ectocarpus sp. CCAP 1310/34]